MAAADDANVLTQFIQWMGLEGDVATSFFDSAMEHRGHKKVSQWADNDDKDKDNKKPDNVFGLPLAGSRKAINGPNFQYGS